MWHVCVMCDVTHAALVKRISQHATIAVSSSHHDLACAPPTVIVSHSSTQGNMCHNQADVILGLSL